MAKTEVVRKRSRARPGREFLDSVLDEALICHVGLIDDGEVYVQPFVFARIGDWIYLHGSVANRMLRAMAEGARVCIEVTLLEGLVLAKSALHHSAEYRSVMVFGNGERVEGEEAKLDACAKLLDHVAKGRSQDARPPTSSELKTTLVVRVPIEDSQTSGKARAEGVNDLEEDLALPVWSGVIPLSMQRGEPVADDATANAGIAVPGYLSKEGDRSLGA